MTTISAFACLRAHAALIPAKPPPMMMTTGLRIVKHRLRYGAVDGVRPVIDRRVSAISREMDVDVFGRWKTEVSDELLLHVHNDGCAIFIEPTNFYRIVRSGV